MESSGAGPSGDSIEASPDGPAGPQRSQLSAADLVLLVLRILIAAKQENILQSLKTLRKRGTHCQVNI